MNEKKIREIANEEINKEFANFINKGEGKRIAEAAVREEVGQKVCDIFRKVELRTEGAAYWTPLVETLTQIMANITAEIVKDKIDKFYKSEKFIDEVVKRIKDKQLT